MHEQHSFIKDLIELQKSLPSPSKDAENPHFRSKYISLEGLMATVLPEINKHNFILVQLVTIKDDQPALTTQLIHTSGEKLETTMLLMLKSADPQGQGSAITYARRYALMSMLGIVAEEDDDGNKATEEARVPNSSPRVTQPQLAKMFARVKELGASDRDTAMKILHKITGTPNLSNLTIQQASKTIERLEAMTTEEFGKYIVDQEDFSTFESLNHERPIY